MDHLLRLSGVSKGTVQTEYMDWVAHVGLQNISRELVIAFSSAVTLVQNATSAWLKNWPM